MEVVAFSFVSPRDFIFLKFVISKKLANFHPPPPKKKNHSNLHYINQNFQYFSNIFFKEKTTRFVGRKTLLEVVWPKWMFNIHFHPFVGLLGFVSVGLGDHFGFTQSGFLLYIYWPRTGQINDQKSVLSFFFWHVHLC